MFSLLTHNGLLRQNKIDRYQENPGHLQKWVSMATKLSMTSLQPCMTRKMKF